MLRENLGLAFRAVAIGAVTFGLYLKFGWIGPAGFAIIDRRNLDQAPRLPSGCVAAGEAQV